MRKLAVIGFPVSHSRSPAMQTAALKAMSLDGDWSYGAIEVPPEGFEAKVREMAAADYAGANVTVPHKEAALALAGSAGVAAEEVGAANTLTFEAGAIRADNTDAAGLLAALPGGVRGRRALVLGAGGAARAAIWALSKGGAVVDVDLEPFEVDIWNRTEARARIVYEELGRYLELGGATVQEPRVGDYGIVVNTTTVGLRGEDPFAELPICAEDFNREQVVVDMVYGPAPSQILAAAKRQGAHTIDGIEVLVQQGARSLQLWTGREPPLEVMRTAARDGGG